MMRQTNEPRSGGFGFVMTMIVDSLKSKILFALVIAVGFSLAGVYSISPAQAQFTVGQIKDMQFGSVIVDGVAGSVTIPSSGIATATPGLFLRGPEQPAEFVLRGTAATSFFIILPISASVANGSQNMTVRDFEADIESGTTSGLTVPIRIKIGATIDIAQNQSPTSYLGTFMFTVQENNN